MMKTFNNFSLMIPVAVFLLLGIMVLEANAQPPTLWTQTYGGNNHEIGNYVQQTTDDGYIVTGYTSSYGAGGFDIWLIKTDANGDSVWSKTFGGNNNDYGFGVQQTSDGGYIIAGWTTSYGAGLEDVWLIKTDTNGDSVWTKIFGGSLGDFGWCVQQTNDGGYIISGKTWSYGAGGHDVWLIKTDANGDSVWTKTFGGSNNEVGWNVQQTIDGGYIIVGYTSSYGAGLDDAWLIKTDANGNTVWTRTFGGSSHDYGHNVQQTSDGGYIIAGWTSSYGEGEHDVWLIKTDTDGNSVWDQTFGGTSHDRGYNVQQTTDDGYIIAGDTYSIGAGENDVWLIKTDANGDSVWTEIFGGTNHDMVRSGQLTSDGGYIITGYTESYGAGLEDVWLIRLDSELVYPDFTVDLTYNSGSPVPAGGGYINFDVFLQNNELSSQNFDLWIAIPPAILPPYVPSRNLTFPGGFSITRPDMNWPIFASWPAGNYDMVWNVGDMSTWTAWASDSFPFEKSAISDGSGFTLWEDDSDPLDQLFDGTELGRGSSPALPEEFALFGNHPNPFNPSTTISFDLPEACEVKLSVFDINGCCVKGEHMGSPLQAGSHRISFDGSRLSSGIYIYHLTAGEFAASGKMVLMK